MSSITDKQQLLERMRESEEAFLAAIEVTEKEATVSPAEGRWSILRITEHVSLAEAGEGKRLLEAPANENPPDTAADQLILAGTVDRTITRNAPERNVPTGRYQSLTEARTELQRRRRENIAFIASYNEDLR